MPLCTSPAMFPMSLSQPLMSTCSLLLHGRNARPVDHRDDGVVAADQIVHADEQRRPLDRIELAFRGRVGLVVLGLDQRVMLRPCHLFSLVATSRDGELVHEGPGSGCVIVVVYIWMSHQNFE